jgi:hypothetical protein
MSLQTQLQIDIQSEKIIKKTKTLKTDLSYTILKYDEKYVCNNDEKLGKYRSVVFSNPESKLLCFTPPKSITSDLFKERIENESDVITTELIEGTMLSLFWDDRINSWELASKGAISANYWFYRTEYPGIEGGKQKTFRRMFLDVFGASLTEDINDLVSINELPRGEDGSRICYNFVLQHPENHIVLDIQNPRLYLVSVYRILSEKNTAEFIPPKTYTSFVSGTNQVIEFPKEINPSTDLEWYTPGIMYLNTATGDYSSVDNPAYMEIKALRGNNPNLHYQYLCLLRMGKVIEFLRHFPKYKKIFSEFYNQFRDFVTNTHQYYVLHFIKKDKKEIPKNYYMLIQRLHKEVYLASLNKENKIIMRRSEIYKSILELAPSEIFFYLHPENVL